MNSYDDLAAPSNRFKLRIPVGRSDWNELVAALVDVAVHRDVIMSLLQVLIEQEVEHTGTLPGRMGLYNSWVPAQMTSQPSSALIALAQKS